MSPNTTLIIDELSAEECRLLKKHLSLDGKGRQKPIKVRYKSPSKADDDPITVNKNGEVVVHDKRLAKLIKSALECGDVGVQCFGHDRMPNTMCPCELGD